MDAITLFAAWLRKNARRFPVPLALVKKSRSLHVYRFQGVPHLEVLVRSNNSIEVMVKYRREFLDLVFDLDLVMKQSKESYYCELCKESGHRHYYRSKCRLLEVHSFEPFLDWCVDSLRKDRFLVIEKWDGGSSTRMFPQKVLRRIRQTKRHQLFIVKPVLPSETAGKQELS